MLDMTKTGVQAFEMPERHAKIITTVARLAGASEDSVYLSGGAVRDLVLERPVANFGCMVDGKSGLLPFDNLCQLLTSHQQTEVRLNDQCERPVMRGQVFSLLKLFIGDEKVDLHYCYELGGQGKHLKRAAQKANLGICSIAAGRGRIFMDEAFLRDVRDKTITVKNKVFIGDLSQTAIVKARELSEGKYAGYQVKFEFDPCPPSPRRNQSNRARALRMLEGQ